MFRLKESVLNEPEIWLIALGIPPQAVDRLIRAHTNACGQNSIASPETDGALDTYQAARPAGDSGFKCKV
jgi:hypothetical protein